MSERFSAATTLLPAIAYGDAFGLPAEGKSADDIARYYGSLKELTPPTTHPLFENEARGTTSDDTQLSVAVAESLIEMGEFSLPSQAEKLVEAYQQTPRVPDEHGMLWARGWGKSTIRAAERLTWEVTPEHAGEKGGSGNGVIMKMAPLALWQTVRGVHHTTRYEQYDALTTMTHDSDIARFCTRLHGDVIASLLEGDRYIDDIVQQAVRSLDSEAYIGEIHMLKRAVADPSDSFEGLVQRYADGKKGTKYGFYVPETLAMTYDILLSSGGHFETAVQWAANLGGDADSTASIVASMIACSSHGAFKRPKDFTEVQDYTKLKRISRLLDV